MKEIVLLGNGSRDVLKKIKLSAKFKLKQTRNLRKAERIIQETDPDFVLCAGTIKMRADGKYYIEIN